MKPVVLLLPIIIFACKTTKTPVEPLRQVFSGNKRIGKDCSKCGVFKIGGADHAAYIFDNSNSEFFLTLDSTKAAAVFSDPNVSFRLFLNVGAVNCQRPDTSRSMLDSSKLYVVEVTKRGKMVAFCKAEDIRMTIEAIWPVGGQDHYMSNTQFEGRIRYLFKGDTLSMPFSGHLVGVPYWLAKGAVVDAYR